MFLAKVINNKGYDGFKGCAVSGLKFLVSMFHVSGLKFNVSGFSFLGLLSRRGVPRLYKFLVQRFWFNVSGLRI